MTKDQIQQKAVDLVDEHKHICLEWATGCGKSLGAMKIIDDIGGQGLLVCKESTHKNNWLEEFKLHKKNHLLDNLDTMLYASLHKVTREYDFIVLDEVHALTEGRLLQLKKIITQSTRIIALSATIPFKKKALLDNLCGYRVKYATITLEMALKLGLLPEPTIYVHKINMLHDDRLKYQKMNNKMRFFKEARMMLPLKKAGLDRKNFLSSLKDAKAKEIIESFRSSKKRFICFSGTVDQAYNVANAFVVNSKVHKDKTAGAIKKFNQQKIHELFAVKMIREGINLKNIETGLIIQLDSGELSFYQMLGRCLRHHTPEMHLIIVKDSQDEVYFNNITQSLNKYIRYV